MKYFHEASDEEISALVEAKATIKDVNQKYIQPDWCDYPGALDGQMGCWSLMDLFGLRHSIGHEYCKTCECYKSKVEHPKQKLR